MGATDWVEEVRCPNCDMMVNSHKVATHLALQCPLRRQRKREDRPCVPARQESVQVVDDKHEAGPRPDYLPSIVVRSYAHQPARRVQSAEALWIVCEGCGEEIVREFMPRHTCRTELGYVRYAPSIGITGAQLVQAVEELVKQRPGRLAVELADMLIERHGWRTGEGIVNSVLYTFLDRRFRANSKFNPRWYPPKGATTKGVPRIRKAEDIQAPTAPKRDLSPESKAKALATAVCPRCKRRMEQAALPRHMPTCPVPDRTAPPPSKPMQKQPRDSRKSMAAQRHPSRVPEQQAPRQQTTCSLCHRDHQITGKVNYSAQSLAPELLLLLARNPAKTAIFLTKMLERHFDRAFSASEVEVVLREHNKVFRSEGESPAFWYLITDKNRHTTVMPTTLAEWGERLKLWAWQRKALVAWQKQSYCGVVEAVTGTGKTRVAIAAAGWCATHKLKTLVIVPTADLQRQWYREMRAALPRFKIDLLGDGDHGATTHCDILISTVQSAHSNRPATWIRDGLLIADECHRYGGENWSKALKGEARYRLGLTATYERLDNGVEEYLDKYFKRPCYRLQYAEALRDDIIAHFKLAFMGVRFTPVEQRKYDVADEMARKLQAKLVLQYRVTREPFGIFIKEVNELASSGDMYSGAIIARQYLKVFNERRAVLAEAEAKLLSLRGLTDAVRAADRTIVFTQTTEATQKAARLLRGQGIAASLLHAGLNRDERVHIFNDFDSGQTDVLAAPKLLDEGIDVPAADLAIIVAASRTRLQMIQRMGRVLRKKEDGRLARIVIMYVIGTSEDPAQGAHEAFLSLVTPVADDSRHFSATEPSEQICTYLNDWRRRTARA